LTLTDGANPILKILTSISWLSLLAPDNVLACSTFHYFVKSVVLWVDWNFLSLALGELYIMFAHTFRKLDVEIHNTTYVLNAFTTLLVSDCTTSPEDFKFRQYFIPYFAGNEFHGKVKPIET
jgi:hypothetical protein